MHWIFKRPATTHELMLDLDDVPASAEATAGAAAKADDDSAVQPAKSEDHGRRSLKQPMTIAAGIDSSCSTLLASPPPPMRVLSSGGQSSAYAALKAMNADDEQRASGLSGALLIRTDKRAPEGVNSASKYFTSFPSTSAAPQGLSSLPSQPTVARNPAAGEGPPSLDSKIVNNEVCLSNEVLEIYLSVSILHFPLYLFLHCSSSAPCRTLL